MYFNKFSKKAKLLNVDWFITKRCNQTDYCRFCFAPRDAFPHDATFEVAMSICNRLAELGVEVVTLCGGEPMLYPHLAKVIKNLHSLGIKVVLYTNATTDFDIYSLFPFIQILSLPVDAIKPEIIKEMRGPEQFKAVCHLLAKLRIVARRPTVKIGTVVSRVNLNDLKNIFRFISESGVVDIWRLYQFSPYGHGKNNDNLFLIADDEFIRAVGDIKSSAKRSAINIFERSRNSTIGNCHIMDSAGNFYRYEEKYVPLDATIFDKPQKIIDGYANFSYQERKIWHLLIENLNKFNKKE
ncbi:MAG: radical SAM protein [Candidatus Falkowbacteria bacterium]